MSGLLWFLLLKIACCYITESEYNFSSFFWKRIRVSFNFSSGPQNPRYGPCTKQRIVFDGLRLTWQWLEGRLISHVQSREEQRSVWCFIPPISKFVDVHFVHMTSALRDPRLYIGLGKIPMFQLVGGGLCSWSYIRDLKCSSLPVSSSLVKVVVIRKFITACENWTKN